MPTVTVGSPVFFVKGGPSPALPKGREFLANALDTAGKSPRPLEGTEKVPHPLQIAG